MYRQIVIKIMTNSKFVELGNFYTFTPTRKDVYKFLEKETVLMFQNTNPRSSKSYPHKKDFYETIVDVILKKYKLARVHYRINGKNKGYFDFPLSNQHPMTSLKTSTEYPLIISIEQFNKMNYEFKMSSLQEIMSEVKDIVNNKHAA